MPVRNRSRQALSWRVGSLLLTAIALSVAPQPGLCGDLLVNLGANATEGTAKGYAQDVVDGAKNRVLAFVSSGNPGDQNFDDEQQSVTFTVGPTNVQIAAFSDDGVDVWVDKLSSDVGYTRWLPNKGRGQALPNLDESFRPLEYSCTANERYTLVIDYVNTLYTGDGDLDGFLLLAYGGEADVSTGACAVVAVDPDEAGVPVGQEVTFTARGENLNDVTWSGGGDPATGTGVTFTTKWNAPGVQTVQAGCGGATATAAVAVGTATFDDDEVVTGFTNPPGMLNIVVESQLTCDPPELASTVELDVQGEPCVKVTIKDSNRDPDTGVVTFEVRGIKATPADDRDGATQIVATLSGHEVDEMSAIVVVPTRIALDANDQYPQPDGPVTPVNMVLNRSTRPTIWDQAAATVTLATVWLHQITIPVEDQFGDRLDELYEGAEIHEKTASSGGFKDIRQRLSGAGTYQDPVGVVNISSSTFDSNSSTAFWTDPQHPNYPGTLGMIPFVDDQDIDVKVGGHEINKITRTATGTPPNTVTVDWPAP